MVRNELWEEMKLAKTYSLNCRYYTNKFRKRNRIVSITLIVIAALGAPMFFVDHWFAFATTTITAILHLLKETIHFFGQPEEELCKIDELANRFNSSLLKVENLWNKFERSEISEPAAEKQLKTIQESLVNPISEMNRLVHFNTKKEELSFMEESDKYLKSKFYE